MDFYETLNRDLIELIGKSVTFKDIETVGQDMFGAYSTHKLEGFNSTISITPKNAARRLVAECVKKNKLEHLITMLIQLDGNYLNDRIVKLFNLENFLYHIAQSGSVYDYKKRKFVSVKSEQSLLINWGALKDGREYSLLVASCDIAGNSKLVEKHGSPIMEKVYLKLWEFLRTKLEPYEGRVWSWQGDGGLLAFPRNQDVSKGVLCCLEILLSLPIYNLRPESPIKDDVILRIALDFGPIKFFSDTGRIVSKTINYAAHLEKSGTERWGLSVSDVIYKQLTSRLQKTFTKKHTFESRVAYSQVIGHDDSIYKVQTAKKAQTAKSSASASNSKRTTRKK